MNDQVNLDLSREQAKRMFVYFSRLMDRKVLNINKEIVGELYDIVVRPSEVYPQSSNLIIRKGFLKRQYAIVDWTDIAAMNDNEIILKIDTSKIKFTKKTNNKEDLALRRDILDQQVVDTANHKVIRVNDVHLL